MNSIVSEKKKERIENQNHSQSQVGRSFPSFRDFQITIRKIQKQIELSSFSNSDRMLAADISLMIAEIYMLADDDKIRIAGNKYKAAYIKSIYSMLEHDHIVNVIKSFKNAKYEIKHIKTYLRTALYNSVFELDAKIENEMNSEE